jgi:hypothetical protein
LPAWRAKTVHDITQDDIEPGGQDRGRHPIAANRVLTTVRK